VLAQVIDDAAFAWVEEREAAAAERLSPAANSDHAPHPVQKRRRVLVVRLDVHGMVTVDGAHQHWQVQALRISLRKPGDSTLPCSVLGCRSTPSCSSGGPTAPFAVPRTRQRNTKTSCSTARPVHVGRNLEHVAHGALGHTAAAIHAGGDLFDDDARHPLRGAAMQRVGFTVTLARWDVGGGTVRYCIRPPQERPDNPTSRELSD
jgi:hypothetical protein